MSSHTRRKTTRYTSSIPIDRIGMGGAMLTGSITPSSASNVTRGEEVEYQPFHTIPLCMLH
jgi:hypothetical protein